MCNDGHEFVRRLRIDADDLVHLLLFNLSVHNARKYFDLAKVIVPYAIDNWQALQLRKTVSALPTVFKTIIFTLKSVMMIAITILCIFLVCFKRSLTSTA